MAPTASCIAIVQLETSPHKAITTPDWAEQKVVPQPEPKRGIQVSCRPQEAATEEQ
jgi:hypothetical protein